MEKEINVKSRLVMGLRILLVLTAAAGFVWFLLPLFAGGYNQGSVLGQLLSAALAFFTLTTGKWKKKGLKRTMYVLLGLFIAGLCWVGFLTLQINSAQRAKEIPAGTTVAVLGAKVNSNGPSLSLKTRLDVALAQLQKDPTAKCIVTGGQGPDEPKTEAEAGMEYLVNAGIAPERIYLEDQSTNTEENMGNAKKIAEEHGLGDGLAIATQGFHQFRSSKLAQDAGFVPYSIVAYTNPLLYPGYYGRELLSLTKYYLTQLF